jgi:P-type Ca2+ transporter type 2C
MWKYANIFTPIHVIFLELIMGPTCSIVYENEGMKPGTMHRPPRKLSTTFLSFKQLSISILQGLVIATGCLSIGFYYMQHYNETTVRTVIFITLLFSNIFLTLVNRSFYHSLLTTIRYKNALIWVMIGCSVVLILFTLLSPPIRQLFYMTTLPVSTILHCIIVAFISTNWIELYKLNRRRKDRKIG